MTAPLSKYSTQTVTDDDVDAVVRVLRSDMLTTGPEVPAFEAELAAYLRAKHVVAVNSGTAALHLALLAHGLPLPSTAPRLHVPTLTFVATANAFMMCSPYIEPALRDVRADTLLLNSPFRYVALSVDLFGQPAPDAMIVDASHSLGAQRDWSQGTYTFSFHPVKAITTGEGGAIATDDDAVAAQCRLLRSHGRNADGEMVALGYNYRMSDIAAVLGRSQLRRIDEMVGKRRSLARTYIGALGRFLASGEMSLPSIDVERSAWHLFPVLFREEATRDMVKRRLAERGIQTQIHYPPVHLQPFYRERFGYKEGDFPVAEDAARRILSLPLHPQMSDGDVGRVVDALGVIL